VAEVSGGDALRIYSCHIDVFIPRELLPRALPHPTAILGAVSVLRRPVHQQGLVGQVGSRELTIVVLPRPRRGRRPVDFSFRDIATEGTSVNGVTNIRRLGSDFDHDCNLVG
jgi:hypothetical protein